MYPRFFWLYECQACGRTFVRRPSDPCCVAPAVVEREETEPEEDEEPEEGWAYWRSVMEG
jgi:hypothetical protein